MTAPAALVADIGATNARFGLLDHAGRVLHSGILQCADHAGIAPAARAYLESAGASAPREAAFAIAGPVIGDLIQMTNHPWTFSVSGTLKELGLERLRVVNDFTAVALGVPRLGPDDRLQIGGGAPAAGEPIGVLGPGSGLGVSGLVATAGGGWRALSGEGGHVTLSPVDARELQLLAELWKEHAHVSAERVLSGMGLVNLYRAVRGADGATAEALTAAAVTERGLSGADPACAEALRTFCAMLGTVAGNLALTLGARGGIYVAGGIVPRFPEVFAASAFRERFLAKGRLRGYLEPIPTYLVTHPLPAFLGLKAVLDLPDSP
jgi:glucokinase